MLSCRTDTHGSAAGGTRLLYHTMCPSCSLMEIPRGDPPSRSCRPEHSVAGSPKTPELYFVNIISI